MEQTHSSDDKTSASHKITHILWKPEVRYRVHNSLPPTTCLYPERDEIIKYYHPS